MLTEPTIQKLKELRLSAMAGALREQQDNQGILKMSFDDRFSMLVDAESLARENRKLNRLLRNAQLKIQGAAVEAIDFEQQRKLDKRLLQELCAGRFIREAKNVLITGPTGCGKTFIACALGNKACRLGIKVRYIRLPRLIEELALYHAEGLFTDFLAKLQKMELLILDDFGITPLKAAQRRDLLEIMDDRYGTRATLVVSQLPVEQWHGYIGDPTIADATMDRLVHNAYRLPMDGESMRKEAKLTK